MVIGRDSDIERATNGDGRAAAELVTALLPVIRRRVASALLKEEASWGRPVTVDVEDLTQEVLLALFADGGRILKAWAPERGLGFDQFVGFVARRHALSILRSGRKGPLNAHPTDPVDLENLPPESRCRDALRSTETRQSLERLTLELHRRLSPAGVDMFRRLFVEEESVSDIARTTGRSAESVYQWRARIRKAALEVRTSLPLES
jgi:RNA polymerase sigma factor (sigma-70 family)